MACYGIEGLPGSGKSLYAISRIIPPFLSARDKFGHPTPCHIYTNIAGLRPEVLCAVLGIDDFYCTQYVHMIDGTDALRYFYKDENGEYRPEGSIFVLDEIQNAFGARDFKSQWSADVIPYLSQHRHYKHTIFWMTQSIDSVDITFRRQTDYVWVLEKLENFGRKNSVVIKKYEGWQVRVVEPYAKETYTYDKKFFPCYESYNSKMLAGDKEVRVSTNVFTSSKGLRIVAVLMVIAIVLIIYNVFHPMSLTTLHGHKKETALISSSSSSPALARGLAPALAGQTYDEEGGELGVDVPCIKNTYRFNGKQYVILTDGTSVLFQDGMDYQKCKQINGGLKNVE